SDLAQGGAGLSGQSLIASSQRRQASFRSQSFPLEQAAEETARTTATRTGIAEWARDLAAGWVVRIA
ncbi:MAG: hypothetical protein M0R80_29280, partial [Proteobacteria bacterium]|nr:hypothetical protein [Pseudomonadota bacterium]